MAVWVYQGIIGVIDVMLVSKCARCGKQYFGWALSNPEHQKCPYCGSRLAIHNEAIELDLDYDSLRQSMNNNLEEWQAVLEKTLALHLTGKLPNITSAN